MIIVDAEVAAAIEKMRSYPDGSYLRCPFCGCKSPTTHAADCAVEVVGRALSSALSTEELIQRVRHICVVGGASSTVMGEICHAIRHPE